jgi:hypothetical protein
MATYVDSWSSLLLVLARPIVLTGLLRDVLTRHFQAGGIEDPRLRDMIWRDGPAGQILIETAHRWLPQQTEKRPAIILKRNAYANIRLGIGDKHLGGPDIHGDDHFTTLWSGSHTLFCLGASGAQAEVLGTEVQRQLTEFAAVIRQQLDLHRFQVLQIGEIGELEEAQENYVVPVTVGYTFQENWVISPHAPQLSKVALSTILKF